MRLLLTSSGLENQSLIKALRNLLSKDFAEANLAYVPTAANVEKGDKWWLINNLVEFHELGFKEVDIVDISAVSKETWLPRLRHADVLVFGGGNTSHLMGCIKKSGLDKELPELLKTRVYMGISAGSMVLAPDLREKETQMLYDEPILDDGSNVGLGLVDFLILPHMNSPYFPRMAELVDEVAAGIDTPLYALDDQSAVQLVDGRVEVISEGAWKKFN